MLGFEYGYTSRTQCAGDLWEAQFGDFANGAQVVIDQFISRASASGCACRVSSACCRTAMRARAGAFLARLERFLQLCARTTCRSRTARRLANYFHILRRQIHRKFRKPLILMTPKSLLRHKRVVSTFAELGPGTSFHRVLWDDAQPRRDIKLVPDDAIRRVVLCSGKVYYDLYEEREKAGHRRRLPLRVEQLYPFPARPRHRAARFKNADMVWCQEEPKNMGAWTFVEPYLEWVLKISPPRPQAALCRAAPSRATARSTGLLQAFSTMRVEGGCSTRRWRRKGEPQWRPRSGCRRSANPWSRPRSAAGSRSRATRSRPTSPLVELETDKVTLEVNAPAAGTLGEIVVKDGDTVAVGAVLGSIGEGGCGGAEGRQSGAGAGGADRAQKPARASPRPGRPAPPSPAARSAEASIGRTSAPGKAGRPRARCSR